ncbi:hypothetical protein AVEN_81824-1 [Araneus ventricosus]|uniref:Uncharacterized protein n=1 Tax=Araneus ventricosus TaxID=182803 RepID=A0A4Y2STL2_ARAVE|nr:hypothetical protein AVEN_81824-1 [Araneus ventricosus]
MCPTQDDTETNTTGQLGILPGRGRKQIQSSSVEDENTAVVEARRQSPHGSVSVPVGSRVLEIPYSTVREILRRVLNFYPTKASLCTYCRTGTRRFAELLNLSSLLECWLTPLRHGTFCGVTEPTFASIGTLTPAIVEFGQRKTITLSRNNPCILTKLQYGVILRLPLSLDRIVLKR